MQAIVLQGFLDIKSSHDNVIKNPKERENGYEKMDGDRSEVIAADRLKYSEQIKAFYKQHGFHFQTIRGDYMS